MSSDGMSGDDTADQQTAAGLGAGEGGDGTVQLTSAEQVRHALAGTHAQPPRAPRAHTLARTALARA